MTVMESALPSRWAAITHSYFYDVNRALPVVLEDTFTRNVWGHDLAYAIDIRLLSRASIQAGRGAAPSAAEALATSPGDVLVYHKDGLGSVRAITDTAGNVIKTYETDEFGIVTSASGGVSEQPLGLHRGDQGRRDGAGLPRARSTTPRSGASSAGTPREGDLSHPLSMNRYTYALDNPLSYTDPSGHESIYDPMGGGPRGAGGLMLGGR